MNTNRARRLARCVVAVAAAVLVSSTVRAAPAGEAPREKDLIEIVEHLEHAIVALREQGWTELAMSTNEVADEVRLRIRRQRGEREGGEREREIARHQMEVMEIAIHAMREAGREDSADLMRRALDAHRVRLQGRRDARAREILAREPEWGAKIELLRFGADLWRRFGDLERAHVCAELAEELAERHFRRDRERVENERRRDRRMTDREAAEREQAMHDLETLELARKAMLEADKRDAADILARAIKARGVRLEGLEGDGARITLEREPGPGDQIELLQLASRIWMDFGHERKAERCNEMAERIARHVRESRGADRGRDRERADRRDREMEELAHELERLHVHLEELRRALEEMRHER
jgi:hypothetical protein